jgi:aminoglycoside/choline kinase family phosphotransferase
MDSIDINESKHHFLKKHIKADNLFIEALANDASMRTYERLSFSDRSLLLMDGHKEIESIAPFVQIDEMLGKKGFSVPEIIAQDTKHGLLLLEDFGSDTYTKLLEGNYNTDLEFDLYQKAVDVLIKLHREKFTVKLPKYDENLLMKEVTLLIDWYFPISNNEPLPDNLRTEYIEIWKEILSRLSYTSSCFVLRDYHVDNLMFLKHRIGIKSVGLLDFQDAVMGSYAYDLVSLLEDARRDVSKDLANSMLHHYLDNMHELDKQKFLTDYSLVKLFEIKITNI